MKNKTTIRILIGVAAIAITGFVIYRIRSRNTGEMLSKVSDEGYETAHDVLFPTKSKRGKNLQYGPVIPPSS